MSRRFNFILSGLSFCLYLGFLLMTLSIINAQESFTDSPIKTFDLINKNRQKYDQPVVSTASKPLVADNSIDVKVFGAKTDEKSEKTQPKERKFYCQHFSNNSTQTADVTQQDVDIAVQRATHAAALLNDFWARKFQQLGYSYLPPQLIIDYSKAAYADGVNARFVAFSPVILASWMREVGNLYEMDGDTIIYIVLAHEWGHIAQTKLGVRYQAYGYFELHADQLAGAFLQDCKSRGILEYGDLEEARTLMYRYLGDSLPIYEEGAHGTGRERLANFDYGFQYGANIRLSMYLDGDDVYLFR